MKNFFFIFYILNDITKSVLSFSCIINFLLNDFEYIQKLGSSGLFNNIIHSYKTIKNTKTLPTLSNGDIDYSTMLNELKYKEIKLPETQDIIEFSGLK